MGSAMTPDSAALKLANIYWLLAAMAFVIAPHTTRLPAWITLFCVLVAFWRGLIAWQGLKTPRWWAIWLLVIGATLGTYVSYGRIYGRDAGSTLLIIMLCLKLLEMHSRRDALVTVLLGFFLVFTNFLYSQTVLMGAYMLLCVWIFTATLIGFNRVGSDPSPRERLVPSAWLIAQAIPLMLVIFILFPRIASPLLLLPSDAHSGLSGLAESMSPGDLSGLSLLDKVAFRADFHGPIPKNSSLYWRGPIMLDFDGRTWRMANAAFFSKSDETTVTNLGDFVEYAVTLEPHGRNWLFAIDLPQSIPQSAGITRDFQLRSIEPVIALKRYEMRSALTYRAGILLGERERIRALRYPEGTNPRAIEFAKKLRADYADDRQLIRQTLLLYNRQFTYTLEPPLLGRNPVDEFLFDTKKGFCEHYSGSFVFLMRAAGIPARVVTGYQGGEVNTVGNYLIVRQADAHAWAEVWLQDAGWVRVDPTAAVSPDRIEGGIDMALGPSGALSTFGAADAFGILRQMRFTWDAFNNQWNQWVIGYNTERQRSFLNQLGIDSADWRNIAVWLVTACIVTAGAVSPLLLLRLRARRVDAALAAYQAFAAKMEKVGMSRAPYEGPFDFLARVKLERPEFAVAAQSITELYVELRYAASGDRAEMLGRMRKLVRKFRPA
jgi:protein-glutamine gamma-glutamyltransferase